jgi:hypothetical protein
VLEKKEKLFLPKWDFIDKHVALDKHPSANGEWMMDS